MSTKSTSPAFTIADAPVYRSLEPRIAFDAALVATLEQIVPERAVPAGIEPPADRTPVLTHAETQQLADTLASDRTVDVSPRSGTRPVIVFIDSAVSDPAVIAAAAPAGAEIVIIDHASDGLAQIAAHLAGRTGISAIHIVSHGSAGDLALGSTHVTAQSMTTSQAADLATISAAMSDSGDILLYGCNVAAGTTGQAFMKVLATATGADVAASLDDTGNAALNGNWTLEDHVGTIDARTIEALEWNGELAPLTITVSGTPTVSGATGVSATTGLSTGGIGFVGLWTNAGTIGGTSIDIRATVTSVTAGTAVSFYTAFGTSFYGAGRDADDLWVIVNGGTATIKWEIFASGTNQTIVALGDPNFRISDIDGDPSVSTAFPTNEVESVAPSLTSLTSYTVDTPTNLLTGVSGGNLAVVGTTTQNAESNSLVGFNWSNVSTWQVSYSAKAGWGDRYFFHDGDGDFTFVAPNTTSMLALDLDGNNSTATGTAYQATYTENGSGIAVVDTDVTIAQNAALGANLGQARLILTNAQAGDVLSVGTLPSGITATIDTSVSGKITVTLSGSDTIANYQTALAAIRFSNASDAPSTVDRTITIDVKNTTFSTTSAAAISTIHVTAVNDAPVDGNETNTVTEDTTLTVANGATGDLLDNASDVDGDTLSISGYTIAGVAGTQSVGSAVAISGVGSITINANGSYSFAPAANFTGAIPVITYTVSDGNGGTDTSTLALSMVAVNDAPIDGNETADVTEDTTLTVPAATGLLANSADVDGGAASITGYTIAGFAGTQAVGSPVSISGVGSLTINANGSYSFAPVANYAGAIPVITYTVSDGNGGADTSTLALSMIAVNDAPVAADDTAATFEDTPLIVSAAMGLLSNDTDIEGDALSVTGFSVAGISGTFAPGVTAVIPTVGSLVINANGSYTFTPAADYNGPVPLATYTVSDGHGGTDTATLSISVTPVNDGPTAAADTGTVTEDTTLSVPAASGLLANDSDIEGDTPLAVMQFTVAGIAATFAAGATATIPSVGDLTINADGSYTFVPLPNYSGTIPIATYTVADSLGATSTSTLTLAITPMNDAPHVDLDVSTLSTPLNANTNFSAGLAGWTIAPQVGSALVNGSATITGPTYAPMTLFDHTTGDASGSFVVIDTGYPSGFTGDILTQTITVTAGATYQFEAWMTSVYPANAPAIELVVGGQIIAATTLTNATVGTWQRITGTYVATTTGPVVIAFRDTNPFGGGNDFAIDDISIREVIVDTTTGYETTFIEDGPAVAIAAITSGVTDVDDSNIESAVVVLTNAQAGDVLSIAVSLPAGITSTIDTSIAGQVTLTLTGSATKANYETALEAIRFANTTDAPSTIDRNITVTVNDGALDSNTAIATIHVVPTNDAPADGDESHAVVEDTTLTVDAATGLLANAADVDGDALSISGFAIAGETGPFAVGVPYAITGVGSLLINADGSYTFTPAADYSGAIPAMTYTISDGHGGTDTSTLTLAITPVNDAPVAVDTSVTTPEDSPINGTLPIAIDVDGDALTYALGGTLPAHGSVTVNADGTYVYTPAPDYNGPDSFTYTVTDGIVSIEKTVTVTVTPVNDAPHVELTAQVLSLVNGSFETDADGNGVPDGWGAANHLMGTEPGIDFVMPGAAPEGNYYAWLNDNPYGTASTAFYQDVATTPGQVYTVTYLQNSEHLGANPNVSAIAVYADGLLLGTTSFSTVGVQPWQSHAFTFTAADANTRIEFRDATNYAANGWQSGSPLLDAVTLSPGTYPPYETTFTENGAAVGIAEAAAAVTDVDDADMESASIVLTNAMANDVMSITGTLPSGISSSIDTSVAGQVTITLTGTASKADYEAAIKAIRFENTSENPNTSDRIVTVTVNDGALNSNTAIATIHVLPVNDAPMAADDAASLSEDAPSVGGNVITIAPGRDTDVDGDTLSITAAMQGTTALIIGQPFTTTGGGVLTLNTDGSYTFAPGTAYNGLDVGETATETVGYTVSDGHGGTATARLVITINGANDAPVVIDPANPGTPSNPNPAADPLNIIPDVTRNDGQPLAPIVVGQYVVDPDGEPLTFALSPTTPAWLSIDPATGEITGTPPANASQLSNTGHPGEYLITVTATDPDGVSVTTTVTLTLVNVAPVATNDTTTVSEDSALIGGSVLANDQDGGTDTDPIRVGGVITGLATPVAGVGLSSPVAGDHGGSFSVAPNGAYTFDPGQAFQDLAPGETRTTTVTYIIFDDNGASSTAELSVTVTGANDAPQVVDPTTGLPLDPASAVLPSVAAQDGTPITPVSIAAYFADVDTSQGAPALSVDVSALPPGIVFDPATGTFSGTPTRDASQGHSAGDPAGTYRVAVTATDPSGASVTTFITFTIANPAPIAQNDAVATSENAPLTGSVFIDNGSGLDTDGGLDTDMLQVGGVITGVAMPVAGVGIGVPIAGSAGGAFVVQADGSYVFAPVTDFDDLAPGETRTTTVTYRIIDGNGGADTATLTVTVIGTNDAPQVIDPATGLPVPGPTNVLPLISAQDSTPIAPVSIGSYFRDVDVSQGAPVLSVDVTQLPPGITFDPATGTFSGTPTRDASQGHTGTEPPGTYRVPVTATDPLGASVTTYITFEIANPAPDAVDDKAPVSEDGPAIGGNVLGNDTDGGDDTDPLSVVGATQGGRQIAIGQRFTTSGGGVLILNADGSYTFDSGTAYNGLKLGETSTESIRYTISDGNGGTATATLTIAIRGENDAPVVVDPNHPGTPDHPVPALDPLRVLPPVTASDGATPSPVDVGAIIKDPDGEPLVFTATGLPPGLRIDPNTGVISGTLPTDASQHGPYSVVVTATDPHGAAIRTEIVYNVYNPVPIANDDAGRVDRGQTTTFKVLANDTDGGTDGDALTVVVAHAEHGMVVVNTDGTVTYKPDWGFEGTDTIRYRISDGNGGFADAVVRLAVSSDPTAGLNEIAQATVQRASSATPDEPRGTRGIVLDAVRALGARLTGTRAPVDGIVLDTVRDLTISNEADRVRTGSGSNVAGLSNFSLILSSGNAEPTVAIETFVRDRVLIVHLGTSGFLGGSDAVEWKVQRTDGRPMPEWLSFAGRSVLMGERAANAEILDLRVTAILPDGTTVSREVRVHAPTGELQPLRLGRQGNLAPRPFWEQIPVEPHLQRADIEGLGRMLQAAE